MSDAPIHAVSGGLAGIISMTLTYPLVVLSTRSAVSRKSTSPNIKPLNTIEALQKVLTEEGVEGLYAGLSSSLVGIAVTNTIFYFGLEEVRGRLSGLRTARQSAAGQKISGGSPIWETMLASTIAGAATTVATNPMWLVQTWMATRGSREEAARKAQQMKSGDVEKGEVNAQTPALKSPPPTLSQAISSIYGTSGLLGFWAGLGPALILVINPVLQYTAFEVLGKVVRGMRNGRNVAGAGGAGGEKLGDGQLFLLGAVAKLVATSVTYPYIVVKSRLQASTHHYKSSFQAVLSILKEEGVAGLYGGLSQKIVQSVLTAAFLFVAQRRVFELVKTLMRLSLARRKTVAAALIPK